MKLENGEECDLKSIMNVFALSPVIQGDSLTIVCEGADEDQAVAGFEKLCKEYSF
jgi:phosphotransferase system HPr-like phosphotransfer protein